MRKLVFIFVSLFVLVSCQKEEIYIVLPEATYPVNYELSADLSASNSEMRAQIHKLEYLVYNDKGEFLHSKMAVMNDTIANIKDELQVGNYHVVLLVADNLEEEVSYQKFDIDTHFGHGETFYGNYTITIQKGINNFSPVLKRLTGRLELVIEDLDSTPENTEKVKIELKNLPERFNVSTKGSEYGKKINLTKELTVEQWKKSRIYFDALATTTDIQPVIEIKFFDENNELIEEITPKSSFNILENTITRLKGKLFVNSGLVVTLDHDWDDVIEVPLQ